MAKVGLAVDLAGLTRDEVRLVEAFRDGATKIGKEHKRDKALALKRLHAAGIVTRKGKLSKHYGG